MALSKCKLAILVFTSLLEICFFGGLQYGWVSLIYILKQEDVYKNLCIVTDRNTSSGSDSGSNDGCYAQDERFNLLFSVGFAVFNITGFICGEMYTKFATETRKIRIGSIFILIAGLLCFAFTSPDIPWLVLPGVVFVGVAGTSFLISNMQVAVLLPKGSSVYVGLINGCYDSSVVTQMAVKALYENGISRSYSYIGVAILCVVISGLCTLLHPDPNSTLSDSVEKKNDVIHPEGYISTTFKNNENELKVLPQETTAGKDIERDITAASDASNDVTSSSVRSIICSRPYILHVLWMSVLLLRLYYFIGSINRLLVQTLKIDGQVSYFTDVMAYTMLGGIISSFIAGQLLEIQDKWFTGMMKTVIPLIVTSCLGILLSSLSFVTSTTALYANFVVLTFFRSFIFSCNMDFVIISFPHKFMSFLFGMVFSVSGVLTLTQYALFTWTKRYDDAIEHVNIFLFCLSVISLLHPVLIFVSGKRALHKKDADFAM
ncbi:solute carrier family 43 member 3-like [Pecten maximus]|uniref:solute carrier family 43 member 3-like n=1 Tax=Pecten maximus TaxID=6579 RepID=UPI001458111C|nr:solute carrier family 43 member 3-like [Pecten maximus]